MSRIKTLFVMLCSILILAACGNSDEVGSGDAIDSGNTAPAETQEYCILEVVDVRQNMHISGSAVMWERLTVVLEGANEQRTFVDKFSIVAVTPDNETMTMKTLIPGDYVRYYGGYKFERLTSDEIEELLNKRTSTGGE